jgi:hypothetical protein
MQVLNNLPGATARQHPPAVATAGEVPHEDARASMLPCRNTSEGYGDAISDDPRRPRPLGTS